MPSIRRNRPVYRGKVRRPTVRPHSGTGKLAPVGVMRLPQGRGIAKEKVEGPKKTPGPGPQPTRRAMPIEYKTYESAPQQTLPAEVRERFRKFGTEGYGRGRGIISERDKDAMQRRSLSRRRYEQSRDAIMAGEDSPRKALWQRLFGNKPVRLRSEVQAERVGTKPVERMYSDMANRARGGSRYRPHGRPVVVGPERRVL